MDDILAQGQGQGPSLGNQLSPGGPLAVLFWPGHFLSLARLLVPPGKHGRRFLFMLLKPSRTGPGLLQGAACRQSHSEAAQARPSP